ncbi:MBG domain-containing protein, partial [Bosea lathyri]
SNVGSYAINGLGLTLNNGNYVFAQATGNATALSVTARPLTVTADALSRIYGNANPSLTYTVGGNGLVNGDTLVGGLATTAGSTSPAGRYAILQGTLAASNNYALSFLSAVLTISPSASGGTSPTPPMPLSSDFGGTFGSPTPEPTPTGGTPYGGTAAGGFDGFTSPGYDTPSSCAARPGLSRSLTSGPLC